MCANTSSHLNKLHIFCVPWEMTEMQWVLRYEQDCEITFTMNEECFTEVLYLEIRKQHFSECLRILGVKHVKVQLVVYILHL
jgi:hypothetical protein